MTADQQRIKIAEACGWKMNQNNVDAQAAWFQTTGEMLPNIVFAPRYTEDLNAMAEAENTLTDSQTCEYFCLLCKLPKGRNGNAAMFWAVMHATSEQRCECFLKVKGLFTEDES